MNIFVCVALHTEKTGYKLKDFDDLPFQISMLVVQWQSVRKSDSSLSFVCVRACVCLFLKFWIYIVLYYIYTIEFFGCFVTFSSCSSFMSLARSNVRESFCFILFWSYLLSLLLFFFFTFYFSVCVRFNWENHFATQILNADCFFFSSLCSNKQTNAIKFATFENSLLMLLNLYICNLFLEFHFSFR